MNAVDMVRRPVAAVADGIRALGSGTMRFSSNSWGAWALYLGRTRIDYRTEVGDPAKNSIVVAVVGWIARNFPEAPVRVSRVEADGSRTPIAPSSSGPGFMLRLLERPNPYYSGVLQWVVTIVDLYTRGDAYWIKVRNAERRVVELWWVPWSMMEPYWEPNSGRFIDFYIYTVDGVQYRIPTKDVVHFRDGIDPINTRRGLSRLASLFREIYTDDEAANFTAVLLKNLGVPGVIIAPSNTGGPVGKVDPDTVKQKFIDTFGGDQRGSVLALSAPTDVKVLSWSPEQLNLRELRRIPEERISAVVGVSAIVAGLGAGLDRSTFTNFGEARRAAYLEAVIPLQRITSADLEVQLLDEFAELEGLDVDFDTSKASALQEALDAVWKRNESSATKGLIKRSDFKAAVGLHVDPEADDVYVIPNNFMVVSGAGGAPSAPTPGPSAPTTPPTPAPGTPPRRRRAEADEPVVSGSEGDGVRCSACGRLWAEQATPPYAFTCTRCKHRNEVGLDDAVEAA